MENIKLTSIYGCNVFSDDVMRKRLSSKAYSLLRKTIDEGSRLDTAVADEIAGAMKEWAIELGATHYTHWFQPMTGVTAEKRNSFISPDHDGGVMMDFSGRDLILGEADASSFPSGGLRATFEARGYTAWDCTSPAFIHNNILCIPTTFCSFNGEALDKKTPLMRSMQVISAQAVRVLHLMGYEDVHKVTPTVGPEQEYFLVERDMYKQRLDLLMTGRTLFGESAPKGQELDDHYYGNITDRVAAYMHDIDIELWKLGVSAKTEHNEAAPAQHELAPVYANANIACDHNQLTMEIMKKVAQRHGMMCLLHEKPFTGVNGSGKHNNWSLATDTGINLFSPKGDIEKDRRFLLFLSAVIEAVDDYADLLRAVIASAGNDHRLGGNEAPPAIISIYLGTHLTGIFDSISRGETVGHYEKEVMSAGVQGLPSWLADTTDRNRTSPFAFTGDKCEFRSVGSSDSIADANTILNTIVADSLSRIALRLENCTDINDEIYAIVAEIWKKHKRIIFNGNNYADAWRNEAAHRGLPNLGTTVDAAQALISDKNIDILSRYGVLSKEEVNARYEIMLENYTKTILIESRTMLAMARKEIYPAVMSYAGELASAINDLKLADMEFDTSILTVVSYGAVELRKAADALDVEVRNDPDGDIFCRAKHACEDIIPAMNVLRAASDSIERVMPTDKWPFPSYTDLMFRRR